MSEISSLILKNTSNQLVFCPPDFLGATSTISCGVPSASRTLTIQDPGTNCNIGLGVVPTVAITATAAITQAQSGSLFYINSAAAAVSLTLPAVLAGLRYKFIVTSSSLASAVTITAPSAVFNACVVSADGTVVASQPQTAKTNVIIGTGAKAGDSYEVSCDGTNYWLNGSTSAHTSVTFS